MKRIITGLFMLAMMPIGIQAHFAKEGMYVHGFGGVAFSQNPGGGISTKTGFNLGAAVGIKQSSLRYEGEFNWQRANTRLTSGGASVAGNANIFALMANIHYDFDEFELHPQIVPSLGAGIGWAHLRSKINGFGVRNANAFAYQVLVNVHYHFSNALSANVGYKYFGTTNFDYVTSAAITAGATQVTKTWQNHMINVGLTYRFD